MKTSFQDTNGKTWNLALTIATARRIKNETGVDFGAIEDGKVFFVLASDPFLLGQVLWEIVEPQASKAGIDVESFFAALDGNVLDEACEALTGAVVNFTRAPLRAAVETILAKTKNAQATALEAVADWAKNKDLDDEVRAKTIELLESGNILQS